MSKWSLAIFAFALSLSPLFGQISIITTSLPPGSLNEVYYAELMSYGSQPFQWSIVPGSGSLPPGLSLPASGQLGGTPTSAGSFSFTVAVRDATGATAQQPFSITIAAITVTTFYLPTSVVFNPYSVQLTASGGSGGPYQWSYYYPGTHTTWIPTHSSFSFSKDGIVSGTPGYIDLEYAGDYFDVVAFDPVTQQQSLPKSLGIDVVYCLANVSPASLPDGEVGITYSASYS